MKMPCERSNQKPKCCHTQRTQELDRHRRKSQPPSSSPFLTASLCLWGQGESSVYLAVLSDPCGSLPGNFALVWLSLYFCCIFCGCGYSCSSGASVGNTGDDLDDSTTSQLVGVSTTQSFSLKRAESVLNIPFDQSLRNLCPSFQVWAQAHFPFDKHLCTYCKTNIAPSAVGKFKRGKEIFTLGLYGLYRFSHLQ